MEELSLTVPAAMTKAEITAMSKAIIAQVEDGFVNPLEMLAKLSFAEQVIKDALAAVRPLTLDEAEKYGKTFTLRGVDYQIKEAGVKYDYSDNKQWRDLQDNIDMLKAQQKGIETELRTLKQCAKTSTTTVCVMFRK